MVDANAPSTGRWLSINPTGGNVGIGTSHPQQRLTVTNGDSAVVNIYSNDGSVGVIDAVDPNSPTTNRWLSINPSGGSVGIGTIHPQSALHVVGDVTVTGDVLLTGADCAEHFDVVGKRVPEPGSVVVIDEDGTLRESHEAYDKELAGVVSGAGDFRPGLVLDKRSSDEGRIAAALVGKVYRKVDAQCAPIEVGDLLTTSQTPGYAMKAIDGERAHGCILGKALRPSRAD